VRTPHLANGHIHAGIGVVAERESSPLLGRHFVCPRLRWRMALGQTVSESKPAWQPIAERILERCRSASIFTTTGNTVSVARRYNIAR
jgi:hypothetical protein